MDNELTTFDFLPVSHQDMRSRGWYYYDFLLITGDAYVDHPSFGAAVIGRVLEAEGFRVAILAQPDYKTPIDIFLMGKPRYAALITAGNLDSMVAHYTASKKPRSDDYYTPGKKAGKRPDRAVNVYTKLVKDAFPGLPVIIGGLEASLRRFAHYDYWDDRVRKPILFECGADLLVYGMGEAAIVHIAKRLAKKEKIEAITDIRGTGFITDALEQCEFPYLECASVESVAGDKTHYARAAKLQHGEHDPVRGKAIVQRSGEMKLIINPPQYTPSTEELDRIYALPFTREVHPMYEKEGGVPAIEEVRFSIIHNRGCFGDCNYCALAFHQGRVVASRSHESILEEAKKFVKHPDFKGYIHDVGGPTANFRKPSCKQQGKKGMCRTKKCLVPPCEHLEVEHMDYLKLLRKLAGLIGVKKVFIRSGIRFDYLMLDKSGEFFASLVQHYISGQLKVAPEHCAASVLYYMGKPDNKIFDAFYNKFTKLNNRYNKKQFLVPYLIAAHPGCTINDSLELAVYMNKKGFQPEQVQIFYPTPGTISTCMYYTGLDPMTMKSMHVPRTIHEKTVQRALMQWKRPKNYEIIRRTLLETGRTELIGFGKHCLIRPKRKKIHF
ncbi:MAG: YgiQ family radical SAM protein [Oscillospiraceae bacterium]|nr:YgiQ family radical SAM protein [Oscillospiraceae bacterium]